MKTKMKTKDIALSFATLIMLLFSACDSEAQKSKGIKNEAKTTSGVKHIEVIQFHSEHRCVTCLKIEKLTRETLKNYPNIPFSLVNVDDKKNEEKAEKFQATGTALFLYNPQTGEKKDLTDFAFMNADNEKKFIEGLKKEIEQFGN